jgi:hypothetical protein
MQGDSLGPGCTIRQDHRTLIEKYSLSDTGLTNLSASLLGGQVGQWLRTGLAGLQAEKVGSSFRSDSSKRSPVQFTPNR